MKKIEVSFNSPQCGWMSIGFDNGEYEFQTTTAHTPHDRALSEILKTLSSLLDMQSDEREFKVDWNRDPEDYKLFFTRSGQTVFFQVVEYKTPENTNDEGEIVFSHHGNVKEFCGAFYNTFVQLYEDRETDEFESNWRQPFPIEEFQNLERSLKSDGQ